MVKMGCPRKSGKNCIPCFRRVSNPSKTVWLILYHQSLRASRLLSSYKITQLYGTLHLKDTCYHYGHSLSHYWECSIHVLPHEKSFSFAMKDWNTHMQRPSLILSCYDLGSYHFLVGWQATQKLNFNNSISKWYLMAEYFCFGHVWWEIPPNWVIRFP